MAEIVMMPKEGITVESCLVGAWQKDIGDSVAIDEVLFEYETDKAAFECVSTFAGVLLHKYYAEGDEAPVLTPVAIIGAEGEDISSLLSGTSVEESQESAPAASEESPESAPAIPEESPDSEPDVSENSEEEEVDQPLIASPRARSFAADQGIDLSTAVPTGPGGRILEADVIAAANAAPLPASADDEKPADEATTPEEKISDAADTDQSAEEAPAKAEEKEEAATGKEAKPAFVDEPFNKIRAVIANTMSASLQRSAQLTHHHSFDASQVLAIREDFKTSEETTGYNNVSVGDIILFVVSRQLAKHPEINALVAEEVVRKYNVVNLGFAVDTPRGLMVPTIYNAEKKTLKEISAEVRSLATAAREGRISPDNLRGGTFTVSNLGATGVEMFTPIINPPQAAILGVCGIVERVKKDKNGQLSVYPSIGLSLTYDHRAIDGAPASRFAAELCKELAAFSWKTLALESERGVL